VIEASKGLDLIKETSGSETEYNSHIWVSVIGAKDEVIKIASQLAQIDSSHAEKYQSNALEYENKLEQLRQDMARGLSEIKNRDIVTCHEAFDYFARDFGLEIQAVVQNDPGAEPSPKEVAEIIEIVNTKRIKAIFAEPQYQTKAVKAIAEETKAEVFTLDPAVSGPMERDAYLNIMRNNLQVLREALYE
jgi:zinc transport system substrate-binding protein